MDSTLLRPNTLLWWYVRLLIGLGTVLCSYSLYALLASPNTLPKGFLLLMLVAVIASANFTAKIPLVSGHVSISDTFIFLTVLLCGAPAATLLAVCEALCSSLLFNKRAIKISLPNILFNCSMMACSVFVSGWLTHLAFAEKGTLDFLLINPEPNRLLPALSLLALTQYVGNTGLAAGHTALRRRQPFFTTWYSYYLWTSLTYLAGAALAGLVGIIIAKNGFAAANSSANLVFMALAPVLTLLFFTYRTYLANIEALAVAAKAEQAERHVEVLNRYIAEQERIRAQFTQMEKMSALGELASGVAHDFNNTLAGILARAQLLLRTDDRQEVRKGLQLIVKTAQDGAKTVKRIQDFARQRRDHDFEPVALDQILIDVSEITRPRWKDFAAASNKHISLNLQLEAQPVISGDPSELREVLVNMVFNAVDAMPAGGTLTLSVSMDEAEQMAVVRVGDTGTGMASEVASRVFDPFFTTKGTSGMGLGLAVSYGIIRRHEGTVEVTSDLGVGTIFSIRLPLSLQSVAPQVHTSDAPVVTEPVPESAPLAVASYRPRILVVEDEDFVRELLQDILQAEGFEAVLTANGQEALERFHAGEFDGVFTDVGLPGLSGWEVARAIREQDAVIPIAIVTGWGEAVGSQEQRAAGVDWVVTKPFSLDKIAEILAELAARHERPAVTV